MIDIVSKDERSRNMARIKGRDTDPELIVRRCLHRDGYRFRLHRADLPGKPDIVLTRYRAAIFVHGCFWHRHRDCRLAYQPKSRVYFWTNKFRETVKRDERQIRALEAIGWRVLVVWECHLRTVVSRSACLRTITTWLKSSSTHMEI